MNSLGHFMTGAIWGMAAITGNIWLLLVAAALPVLCEIQNIKDKLIEENQ